MSVRRTRRANRDESPGGATSIVPRAAIVVLLMVAVLTVVVRLRLADVPLERDEGEYAYAGQLILAGTPPYVEAYNMKFPGTYYAYALVMALFGTTPSGIRIGLLAVNLATALVVFQLGRRLAGTVTASVAATTFLILSLSPETLGVFGHATNFVLLPALIGLLALLAARESGRILMLAIGGLALGLAVLMKQHGAVYLPLGAALVIGSRADTRAALRNVGLVLSCATLPFLILCVVFVAEGALERFWFWTFRYAWAYVSLEPVSRSWPRFLEGVRAAAGANAPLWLMAVAGAVALWTGRHGMRVKLFVSALVAVSFVGVCPGFYFRSHYFVLVLPAIALLVGFAVEAIGGRIAPGRPTARWVLAGALFAGSAGACLLPQRALLFTTPPIRVSRTLFGANPFPESVEIGRYLRDHSGPADRIAVLGSEPQIYFYAERRSATGYLYTYALMEPQPYASTMQREFEREIEAARPAFLVDVQIPTSWLVGPRSDKSVLSWARRYIERCYEPAGLADIVSEERTNYVWGDDLRGYARRGGRAVFVHRRTSDSPCSADGGR